MTSATRSKRRDPEKLFVEAGRFEEKDDLKNAFQCFHAVAHLGHALSQVSLGNFYADGVGVRKDRPKAAYWYKKAYRNGYRDGAMNLAIDRRNEGNTRSAVVWFKKAIAMNSGDAFVALAKIYGSRKRGQRAAMDLLRRALRLGRDHISEETKEEAKCLLEGFANPGGRMVQRMGNR